MIKNPSQTPEDVLRTSLLHTAKNTERGMLALALGRVLFPKHECDFPCLIVNLKTIVLHKTAPYFPCLSLPWANYLTFVP